MEFHMAILVLVKMKPLMWNREEASDQGICDCEKSISENTLASRMLNSRIMAKRSRSCSAENMPSSGCVARLLASNSSISSGTWNGSWLMRSHSSWHIRTRSESILWLHCSRSLASWENLAVSTSEKEGPSGSTTHLPCAEEGSSEGGVSGAMSAGESGRLKNG